MDDSIHAHVVMAGISAFDNRKESTSVFRQIIATTGEDDTFIGSETPSSPTKHSTKILDVEFK